MAKKRKNRNRQQIRPAQGRPSQGPLAPKRVDPAVTPLAEIQEEVATHPALPTAPTPPAPTTPPIPVPASLSDEDLRLTWNQCQELIAQAKNWIALSEELTTRASDLKQLEQQVEERANAIEAAEADQRDGWAGLLAATKEEATAAAREAFDAEIAAERAAFDESLAAERRDLQSRKAQLEADLADLNERADQLSSLQIRIFQDQTERGLSHLELIQNAEQAQARANELEAANRILHNEFNNLTSVRDRALRQKLLLRGRSLDEVLQRLTELEAREIDDRPDSPDVVAALQREAEELRARTERLELDVQERSRNIADLRSENDTLRVQAAQDRLGEEVTSSWQEMAEVANLHVQRLRSEFDSLRASAARNPFPRLKAIEESTEPVRRTPRNTALDLRSLTQALRNSVVSPDHQPLYYSQTDIRGFIAGLSASQLMILQGASGTGKTSLPRAVANALGWGCGVVAVQAGWRDQQDLIGYYNAFDSRFQEEDFLALLYEAGSEQKEGRPFLVVLDEANLSSMEHYFATFLSAMELKDPQSINLSPVPHSGSPIRTEDGTRLMIPGNVWFVATANQDETTRRFAPKTIDRSTVLELERVDPWNPDPAAADWIRKQDVTMDRLHGAFDKARRDYSTQVDSLTRPTSGLQIALDEAELSVGERFFTQSRGFIATFLACGGKPEEAVEHLWLRKVLYRLPERGEADRDVIEQLRSALSDMWTEAHLPSPIPRTWNRRLDKAVSQ